MKKFLKFVRIAGFIFLSVILFNCKKEAVLPEVVKPEPIPTASAVNYFIWASMHDYYLWTKNIPNLNKSTYLNNTDSLNKYLNNYNDANALFTGLLYQYKVVDKWSFLVNDYTIIENWIQGISKTMGYDFAGYWTDATKTDVIAVVRLVQKDSPADKAGIKRGDIISKVDGVQLTGTNFDANMKKESCTLSFASIVNGALVQSTRTAALVAVEFQDDPVYFDKIFTINGIKIGYLVYNGFTSAFDLKLNTVFQKFKAEGIQKLILDLRYNGGGSVQTAIYLASMIYTTDNTKVFAKSLYNDLLQQYYTSQYGSDVLLDKFTGKISATTKTAEATINTLGLKDIYIIQTGESASASELLINGLKPYMTVRTIGSNTVGKYTGSFTIKDYDEKGVLNTTHKYAMQPITVKIANSQGVSDYVTGLVPDIAAEERAILLPFGDENEIFLKVALDDIRGLKRAIVPSALFGQRLKSSKDLKRFSYDMYINRMPSDFPRSLK